MNLNQRNMNNEEQQATTEFLRIAEGMVRYVDKECSVEGSGKAVLCVAVDCNGDEPKTMLAASGSQSLLAAGIVASIVTHEETKALFDKVCETLERFNEAAAEDAGEGENNEAANRSEE